MNVLLLGPVPPPFGGVQVHLMALRAHLRASGDRVSVINVTRNRQPDHDELYFPASASAVLTRIARLNPDILHVHLGGELMRRNLALCLACAAWPGGRGVLTFHSGGFPSSPQGQAAAPDSLAGRVLQRLDAVIGVNAAIADCFRRFGCEPARVHLIEPQPASADPAVREAPWPARFTSFVARHDPVLLTVGLLEPEYGLDRQIAALGQVRASRPRAGLIIIGSGSLEQSLRERIAASAASEHILLAGDVPHTETLVAIARCDLLLRPTEYDGDSVSVREALALGTPVLASDTGMRPSGVHLLGDREPATIARDAVRLAGRRTEGVRATDATDATANLERVRQLYRALVAR